MLRFLLLATCVAVSFAKIINFQDCGSVSGKVNTIDFTPCNVEPCELHTGNNYTAKINFDALVNSTGAKTIVHGIIERIPVPFPVPEDCCVNKNLICPIVPRKSADYSNYVFVRPEYPKIRLVAKWEVKDDNKNDIMCLLIPLVIVD